MCSRIRGMYRGPCSSALRIVRRLFITAPSGGTPHCTCDGRIVRLPHRKSGPERWVDEDLGAVGAPGAPSAVGISLDAEAVVDLGVVSFAEQRGVLQAGLAAVDPLEQMVDVAPVG